MENLKNKLLTKKKSKKTREDSNRFIIIEVQLFFYPAEGTCNASLSF